jgi:cytochrome c peroxidase
MQEPNATRVSDSKALGDAQLVQLAQQRDGAAFRIIMQRHNRRLYRMARAVVANERGKTLFNGPAKCATCHVPPLFTEPGNNLHAPAEVGVDSFQADRSPTHMYRTAPLAGLWTHQKGGFYHDGRFAKFIDVVNHYDEHFSLGLSAAQKSDLVEYLKGL